MRWTSEQIPPLEGRLFVVTGATSGLGLATTRALAAHGGRVVLAVRDEQTGRRVAAEAPGLLTVRRVDLARPDSVRRFAAELHDEVGAIDVLINNAGVLAPPRTLTAEGHELQFATNHLGHFALTGLLLDLLAAGDDPRVVTVTSINHRLARLRFDDPTGERSYSPMGFYGTSKLANAIFGWELHRRLTAAGSPVRSVLAHPGYSSTGLLTRADTSRLMVLLGTLGNPVLGSPAPRGAWAQLYAATAAQVAGGQLIGPGGPGELRGHPKPVRLSRAATDPANGRRLWDLSEQATGVRFGLPDRPQP